MTSESAGIGPADFMTRNLSQRMEIVSPVRDPGIKAELDNSTAWDMQPDGQYLRRHPAEEEAPRGAQHVFIERSTNE